MYDVPMKRLQIYIEEELDEALGLEAARKRVSKAALIRQFVAERLGKPKRDPLDSLLGASDAEPAPIDDVVYGR